MRSTRLTRITREVLLTSAAVLGVLCILLTSVGLLFGIRPLLFRSGSMSPTIQTGDLSLSRTVAAADLRPGDVVSVLTADGQRVTHRVVSSTYVGGATRELTLKGDANKAPDTQVYDVTSAQRVIFTVPKAGYVVNWFSRMPGVLVLVAYVLGMLLLASGKRIHIGSAGPDARVPEQPRVSPPDPLPLDQDRVEPGAPAEVVGASQRQRRKRTRVVLGCALVGVAIVAVAGWALPTWAAWTSTVAVTNTTFTAATVFPLPAPTITACSRNTNSGEITVTWSSVAGATSYNVKLSNPSSTLTNKTSPFTTTTIGKNGSGGTVKIVALNGATPSPDSVAWTYDGTGSGQSCHP
ncbi:MAG: signal peptidase [Marmoricola sp.]|nr:signal peptidase [Marmoricola sp.]